jgi:hypothetical protein
MPPRYTYWTIILDDLPTAFRAAKRDELLPTFERLREKHPNARLQWFARGRVWNSPDEARLAETARRTEKRGRDWRPGGQHKDPRDRFDRKKRARDRQAQAGAGAAAPREGRNRDRSRQRPFDRSGRPPDREPRGPRSGAPAGQGRGGNRERQAGGRPHSPRDVRPRSAGFDRFGRDRDQRSAQRTPKPDHRRARPPHGQRPDDRRSKPERGRYPPPSSRETMPGRKPDHRSQRPPRGPSDERREKRRQSPPPRPPGPDREPTPGNEPPPRPTTPEDIITPAPPPERGRGVPGPQGTRLMKRPPPRSRE